ncbi:unnamed protein product, partial [Rotaria sp. Silwood1]
NAFYSNDLIENLQMKRLCWTNTVELIEHLNITNEEIHIVLPEHQHKYENKSISIIKFYKNELSEIIDGTRLKSIFLRYIFLTDLIILSNSLTMSLLEKLLLIDLYDHSKLSLS